MTVYIVVSDDSLAFSTYIGCEGISAISLNYIVHSTGEDGIQKTEYRRRNTEYGIPKTGHGRLPNSNEFARKWFILLL